MLENVERVDKALNESILELQIDGKDNENVGIGEKARMFLGVKRYTDTNNSDYGLGDKKKLENREKENRLDQGQNN